MGSRVLRKVALMDHGCVYAQMDWRCVIFSMLYGEIERNSIAQGHEETGVRAHAKISQSERVQEVCSIFVVFEAEKKIFLHLQ